MDIKYRLVNPDGVEISSVILNWKECRDKHSTPLDTAERMWEEQIVKGCSLYAEDQLTRPHRRILQKRKQI